MELVRALHFAVNVTDLTVAEHFYGQVLGLTKVDRNLKFPGAWYQVDSMQVHLIPVPESTGDAPRAACAHRFDEQRWGRNHHMAFAVKDLAVAQQQLTKAGYPVQMSASGRSALFTEDPDGNIIELSQI